MRPSLIETDVVASDSLASSTRRHCAKLRSSSLSHLEVAGKLGRKKLNNIRMVHLEGHLGTYAAMRAMPTVIVPSMMNSHLHPEILCAPSRPPKTPAASNPPNMFATELPA